MLKLLEDIVNIDGGSYDKAGVDAVGSRIRRFLEENDIACETVANETLGDALRATVGGPSNSAIMLLGHRDTVFPKGEPTRRPFRIENGRAYGPGVADMKAGLVMNAFVLAAFNKFGGAGETRRDAFIAIAVAALSADRVQPAEVSNRLPAKVCSGAPAKSNTPPMAGVASFHNRLADEPAA